ncbi:MAG: adenylate/guanylate cyclase domain-containing protein [Actinomycetota bacterium]
MTTTRACPNCGAQNAPAQRFCGSCGTTLTPACPSCGEQNPPDFRFCGSCGAPLGEQPSTDEVVERRWATVLFGDLSGFTTLSEHLDPEDVRAMADRAQTRFGAVVERFGGTVISVMGDGFMVVFGAPVAHEDDAERAVRAALALQETVREAPDEFGGLPLRVGVNTGPVIFAPVGPKGRRDPTAMGDTTNTAARLQTAAPKGGVLVGPETFRATTSVFRYEAVEPVSLKGKEQPVPAWIAIEAVSEETERVLSEHPIVGRAHELRMLIETWARVMSEQRPHLVSIVAPPGVGKSRLAAELADIAAQAGGRIARGRTHPYGEQTGYEAFGRLIRGLLGIYVTDTAEVAHSKLRDRLNDIMGPDEVAETMTHLSVLAGFTSGSVEDRSRLFAAARRFVEALAREQPTVFVFEDIHWGDPSFLQLVEYLAARCRDASALFVALARPTLYDAHPSWGGGLPAHTAIALDPLPEDDARALALDLLRGVGNYESVVEQLLKASGGNPLFIEELAAAIREGREVATAMPTNVRAIIAARLDALPAGPRAIMLNAAVVGEVFWRGVLERLSGDANALDDHLDMLELRDLIRRADTSRIQGDVEFSFKHSSIRDVAYDTLAKSTRRDRHRAVAEYLEARASGSAVSPASLLAHHWLEAGDTAKSIEWLIAAAEQATRGWAGEEAIGLLDRARSLVPDDDEARIRKIRFMKAIAMQSAYHREADLLPGAMPQDQSGKPAGSMSPPIS